MATFFLASAGASSAYLTVSEIFPMETRALAIAFFYAVGTGAAGSPARFFRAPDRRRGEPGTGRDRLLHRRRGDGARRHRRDLLRGVAPSRSRSRRSPSRSPPRRLRAAGGSWKARKVVPSPSRGALRARRSVGARGWGLGGSATRRSRSIQGSSMSATSSRARSRPSRGRSRSMARSIGPRWRESCARADGGRAAIGRRCVQAVRSGGARPLSRRRFGPPTPTASRRTTTEGEPCHPEE